MVGKGAENAYRPRGLTPNREAVPQEAYRMSESET